MIDVKEDVKSVHDGALTSGRAVHVVVLPRCDALKDPGALGCATDPPWANNLVEHFRVDRVKNTLDGRADFLNNPTHAFKPCLDLLGVLI
jgi:hypothetical protein